MSLLSVDIIPPSDDAMGLYGWKLKNVTSDFIVGVAQCAESSITISLYPSSFSVSVRFGIVDTPPYNTGITIGFTLPSE